MLDGKLLPPLSTSYASRSDDQDGIDEKPSEELRTEVNMVFSNIFSTSPAHHSLLPPLYRLRIDIKRETHLLPKLSLGRVYPFSMNRNSRSMREVVRNMLVQTLAAKEPIRYATLSHHSLESSLG